MIVEIASGYKKTHYGVIPDDWSVVKLSDLGDFGSGTTPSRANKKYFDQGNIPWVKTTDLNNSNIYQTEESVTHLALKETSLKVYPENTILVAMYGGFNQIGRTGILTVPSTINQALTAIVTNDLVDAEYLLNWLNYRVFYWKKFAGSSRKDPNITGKDVKDFPVYLPPITEQYKINSILKSWDKAIIIAEDEIALLRSRNKGLSQQLLSGKKRITGFNSTVAFTKLNGMIKEVSKRNKDLSVSNVLSVTNSRGFINQSEQFDRSVASVDLSNYKVVKKGQFAYNPSRVNVGSLDLLKNFEEGILSPMYVVFKTDPKQLLPEFLYYHLKSWWFTGHIPQYVQGSVRDSLSFDGLQSMNFFIPSIDEQSKIVEVLSEARQELEMKQKHLEELKNQRKGLMQKLLTGEVRVNISKV